MRHFAVSLLLMLAASAAAAAEPGYYKVAGVAADDRLNIRSEPTSTAETLGDLAPGAEPVEVLEIVSSAGVEWGRVHASDGDGWVSMKFLTPIEVPVIGGSEVPEGLYCGGSEPFWGADFSKSGVSIEILDETDPPLPVTDARSAAGRNHRFSIVAMKDNHRITAMIAKGESCSDGMSDRNYSWRADILVEKPGNSDYPILFEGCCRLPVSE
jgi:uncharacterized membrane protein